MLFLESYVSLCLAIQLFVLLPGSQLAVRCVSVHLSLRRMVAYRSLSFVCCMCMYTYMCVCGVCASVLVTDVGAWVSSDAAVRSPMRRPIRCLSERTRHCDPRALLPGCVRLGQASRMAAGCDLNHTTQRAHSTIRMNGLTSATGC